MSWLRMNHGLKCPNCGKGNWCMVSDKSDAFLCMRVASPHPVKMADGSVGYIHKLIDTSYIKTPIRRDRPRKEVDWPALWDSGRFWKIPEEIKRLATELGVTYSSLLAMDTAWDSRTQAWAWPMRNGYLEIVGVRTRMRDGSKRAITGSRNALFIPLDVGGRRLWVFEGVSDVCAAVSLGLNAVGRPSCNSGMFDIILLCQRTHPKEVVIVADSDKVGIEGAESLSRHLPVKNCTITVPGKDMRTFLQQGGTARMLEDMVSSMVWNLPNK